LGEPAEKRFDGGNTPGKTFGAAWNIAFMLQPIQEAINIIGGQAAQGGIRWEVTSEQVQITKKSLNGERRSSLVIEKNLPGSNSWNQGSFCGDMNFRGLIHLIASSFA